MSTSLGSSRSILIMLAILLLLKEPGDPCILLCGHMDTVPGQVPVRIEDGYIYGRGASDAKSPLIAMLLAASEFPKQRGTVIFAGVVDEEGNATGIKQLVKSKIESIMRSLANRLELTTLLLHTKAGLHYG